MVRRCSWILLGVTVVLAVALATAGLAKTLQRLPQDFPFSQGEGSPGKVTFSHLTHVDQKKPNCTVCHPALFKILEKGTPAKGGPIRHSMMEGGRQCGACHNGKAAFGLDNCAACHRGE